MNKMKWLKSTDCDSIHIKVEKYILLFLMWSSFVIFLGAMIGVALGYWHQLVIMGISLCCYLMLKKEYEQTYVKSFVLFEDDLSNEQKKEIGLDKDTDVDVNVNVNVDASVRTVEELFFNMEQSIKTQYCDEGSCKMCDYHRKKA